MKKLIYVFYIHIIFISYCNAQYNLFNQKVIPDAMDILILINPILREFKKSYLNIDSFPCSRDSHYTFQETHLKEE